MQSRWPTACPVPRNPFATWMTFGPWAAFAEASTLWAQAAGSLISPYDVNPFGLNPLKDVLTEVIDFDHLQTCKVATRLFVAATNVRSGKVKIFDNAEMSVDAILASACLPNLFKAVEIGTEAYWDGGFRGNPAIFPLIYRGASRDVVVVHINPIRREDVPQTAGEIRDRMNEISFNSSLMDEMRAIAFVQKLVDENRLDAGRYKFMRVHDIRDDIGMAAFGVESKLSTDWAMIERLRDLGRDATERWFSGPAAKVGHESTTPLKELYL
jgi:NTE family protein